MKSIGDEFGNIVSWYHGVEVNVEMLGGRHKFSSAESEVQYALAETVADKLECVIVG